MRVLELGSYLVPAYAGLLLAEQGHQVTKWVSPTGPDPIEGLIDGAALWAWVNHGKQEVYPRHAADVAGLEPGSVDGIIDNVRASTWERWHGGGTPPACRG